MLFSEIYGTYFRVVGDVLTEASEGRLTERHLTELVQEKAFAESSLSIPSALKNGDWPLLDGGYCTVLRHRPTMPLTALEKRWLKALLLDPRIALFSPDITGLDEVEPLFQPDTFVLFDQYTDGDPYEDPDYIQRFQTILRAIREKRKVQLQFLSSKGLLHTKVCMPYRLEYSAKDDKFRLLAAGSQKLHTVNLARVSACELMEAYSPNSLHMPERPLQELVLLLQDERNGLERVLLHFSHFEKETQRLDDGRYQVKLRYDRDDETELLIRVLSFGPVLEVQSPERFIELVRERIEKQCRISFPEPPVCENFRI